MTPKREIEQWCEQNGGEFYTDNRGRTDKSVCEFYGGKESITLRERGTEVTMEVDSQWVFEDKKTGLPAEVYDNDMIDSIRVDNGVLRFHTEEGKGEIEINEGHEYQVPTSMVPDEELVDQYVTLHKLKRGELHAGEVGRATDMSRRQNELWEEANRRGLIGEIEDREEDLDSSPVV